MNVASSNYHILVGKCSSSHNLSKNLSQNSTLLPESQSCKECSKHGMHGSIFILSSNFQTLLSLIPTFPDRRLLDFGGLRNDDAYNSAAFSSVVTETCLPDLLASCILPVASNFQNRLVRLRLCTSCVPNSSRNKQAVAAPLHWF